jgi:hypothetical protein
MGRNEQIKRTDDNPSFLEIDANLAVVNRYLYIPR